MQMSEFPANVKTVVKTRMTVCRMTSVKLLVSSSFCSIVTARETASNLTLIHKGFFSLDIAHRRCEFFCSN